MDGITVLARLAHELVLFAGTGFLIGGADDLAVDLGWLFCLASGRCGVLRDLDRVPSSGRLAVFVAAWQEEAVIGAMVGTALARAHHPDWRLYVGTYPNDPATRIAVEAAAGDDPRVRLVVGDRPGPTTKAGCLNWLWQAMLADEAADGVPVRAVVLHDAEDALHPDELGLFATLIGRTEMVQLPVHAVPVRGHGPWAWLVSGVYSGEFAEAHGKDLPLREAIGAAVPSAGVGCAIARDVLARAAQGRAEPFDPGTLTEDYELGLRIGRGRFARVASSDGSGPVAVRACFPHSLRASVRQKARWIAGISFHGWDRLGWSGGVAERWMRARDRRAPLAALVLLCGYAALLLWAGLRAGGAPVALGLPRWLGLTCTAALGWRMVVRFAFTARAHGVPFALLTPVHLLLGNLIAIGAAARALLLYVGILRTGRVRWDKTAHVFPE